MCVHGTEWPDNGPTCWQHGAFVQLLNNDTMWITKNWWGHTVVVEQLPEHRLVYLDYQGPVSGNRGSVSRVLDGTIQWQECSATSLIAAVQSPGIRADTVKVHMKQGELRIRKLTNHLGDGRQWELELRLTTVNGQLTTDN